jgi:transposase
MARRCVRLTAEQRAELEHTRDRDRRPDLREMAAALVKIADGLAPDAVARRGRLKPRKPDTVYRWLTVYQPHGLAGLRHQPRGHRGFSPSAGPRAG